MKKALVQGTRICEFGTPFPVHEDLKWVDVADDTTTQDTYVDGSVVKYVVPTLSYAEKRQSEYPPLEEQFDEIYHNGIDSWKAIIKTVKDKYAKE